MPSFTQNKKPLIKTYVRESLCWNTDRKGNCRIMWDCQNRGKNHRFIKKKYTEVTLKPKTNSQWSQVTTNFSSECPKIKTSSKATLNNSSN
jgi:hypothetical protein